VTQQQHIIAAKAQSIIAFFTVFPSPVFVTFAAHLKRADWNEEY
jgi:hypothetical protein